MEHNDVIQRLRINRASQFRLQHLQSGARTSKIQNTLSPHGPANELPQPGSLLQVYGKILGYLLSKAQNHFTKFWKVNYQNFAQ